MSAKPSSVATRPPAAYGQMVVKRISLRAIAGIALLGLLPALLLAAGVRSMLLAPAELLAITAIIVIDRVVGRNLDRRIQGNVGEIRVGRILDDMRSEGWMTLHDIDTGHGNIDHIAVGPGGLLTIETKSHRGFIRVAKADPRWLRQAYAQRKYLERITGSKADCLIVFSNARLDRAPARKGGVLLLPARMLTGHLNRRRPTLARESVQELHRRLADTFDAVH